MNLALNIIKDRVRNTTSNDKNAELDHQIEENICYYVNRKTN